MICTFHTYLQMDVRKYMFTAACGTKLYLTKEKIEDVPKAREFIRRLRFLDIFSKTLMSYWMAKKLLSFFNIQLSVF